MTTTPAQTSATLTQESTEREIVITRLINAPRELVYRAFAEPEHLIKWWGPRGFTNTFHEIEIKTGGVWRFMMHGPDGTNYPNKIVFQEVVKNEKLVYLHSDDTENGEMFQGCITFEAQADKTLLTLKMIFSSVEDKESHVKFGAVEGGNSTLDRMEEMVAKLGIKAEPDELVITRVLKAPRELVFKAWTEEKHFSQWQGPKGSKFRVIAFELRPGGILHYAMGAPDGSEMYGRYVSQEIKAPERLSYIVSFTDAEGKPVRHPLSQTWPLEVLNTLIFTELEGKRTMLTLKGIPVNASHEDIDTFRNSHHLMEQGFGGMLEVFDAYISEIQNS